MESGEILSLAELRQLRRERPAKLFAHLREVGRDFVFGVEDHRDEPEAWGGEFRVLLNRNIELHLVPRFNASMENDDELPQFAVLPDADRAGTALERKIPFDGDDVVPGVTFFVEPERYARLVEELSQVAKRYDDWDVIPDAYFLETDLVRLLATRVLEHPTVREERAFDFRRGLVWTGPRSPEDEGDLDHEEPSA